MFFLASALKKGDMWDCQTGSEGVDIDKRQKYLRAKEWITRIAFFWYTLNTFLLCLHIHILHSPFKLLCAHNMCHAHRKNAGREKQGLNTVTKKSK